MDEVTTGADPSGGVSAADPTPETQAAPVAAASGAVSADEFADLETVHDPQALREAFKTRLSATARARDEFKSQLEQAQAYEPWAPVLETLQTNYGLTPEQALQYLQNPPTTAPAPEALAPPAQENRAEQFSTFLVAKGIDANQWWELDPNMQAYWTNEFERNERDTQAQAQQQKAEAERTAREADLELKAIQTDEKYKSWSTDPVLTDVLRLAQANGYPGKQVADKIHESLTRLIQASQIQYLQGKQADAQVPVVTGGSAPPPMQKLDLQDRSNRLAALDQLTRNNAV